MNEPEPRTDAPEPVYDETAQAEIIALAARLQADQGVPGTLSEIERAAAEAGIEPQYVRKAATLWHTRPIIPPSAQPKPAILPYVPAGITVSMLAIAQTFVVLSQLLGKGHPDAVPAAFITAVVFGAIFPKRERWQVVAAVAPIAIAAVALVLYHEFLRSDRLHWSAAPNVLVVALLQGIAAYWIYSWRLRIADRHQAQAFIEPHAVPRRTLG